jgi:hypothetical protein
MIICDERRVFMKKVSVEIALYEVDELEVKAKERAIEEHRNFLISECRVNDNDPYGEAEYLNNIENFDDDEYVLDDIRANEYLFFSDGEMANTSLSLTKGTTFKFKDQEYLI